MSDVLELNVNMDYFMTPGAELAPTSCCRARTGPKRVGNWARSSIPGRARSASAEGREGPAPSKEPAMGRLGLRCATWASASIPSSGGEQLEEMQLWRLNGSTSSQRQGPITDYEVAAKQGYFIPSTTARTTYDTAA